MALAFLSLTTVLAIVTSPARRSRRPLPEPANRDLRLWGTVAAVTVFAQSVLGGLVRHADAGMACPDFPTCGGQWIPRMSNALVGLHFAHRVVGVVATVAVLVLVWRLLRRRVEPRVRRFALAALGLVALQMTLGVVSVLSVLSVVPVSLHTLGAASLLWVLVTLSTWGWAGWGTDVPNSDPAPRWATAPIA
jgi:heme A synthase